MSYQVSANQLSELQQIEAIIQQDNNRYLSTEIINHIPINDHSLPIYALSLGSTSINAPCITFVGGIHGLERIGTQVVLTFLQTLLMRLQWDQSFEDILHRIRIVFLPIINPVGMMNNTRSNGQGVDLMRNAPVDCSEQALWLGGGHRISARLPWYRGQLGEPMQAEAQSLCQ